MVSLFLAETCAIASLPSQLSTTVTGCEGGGSITVGVESCTYECAAGYTISDSTAITCTATNTLSLGLPTCTGMKSINSRYCKSVKMKVSL